jgi:hypothetical protein
MSTSKDIIFWICLGWTAIPYFYNFRSFHNGHFKFKRTQGALYLLFILLGIFSVLNNDKTLGAILISFSIFIYLMGFVQLLYFSNEVYPVKARHRKKTTFLSI